MKPVVYHIPVSCRFSSLRDEIALKGGETALAVKTFKINGMTCDHCKRAVEGALSSLNGVKEVSVNLKTNSADVTYNENQVTESQMKQAIEEQGYDVK